MRKLTIIFLFLMVNVWFALGWAPPSPITPPNTVPDAIANMNFGITGGSVPAAPGGTTCSADVGETADGTGNTQGAGWTWVTRLEFGCIADANDTTFNLRIDWANLNDHEVIMLIYEDNGGEPGDLIWEGPRGDGVSYSAAWGGTPTWITNTVDVSLSGDYLWIGFHSEHTGNTYYYTGNDPARTGRTIFNAGTFPDVDATWDTANDATIAYGISAYLSY